MLAKEHRELAAELVTKMRELGEAAEADERVLSAEEKEQDAQMVTDYKRHIEAAEREERNEGFKKTMDSPIKGPGDIGRGDFDGKENAKREAAVGDTTPSAEDRSTAIRAWAMGQYKADLTDGQLEAAQRCGINPHQRELTLALTPGDYRSLQRNFVTEKRALSAVKGASGAVLIPEGFVPSIETALLEFGGMRQVSDVMRTATGNDLPWPMSNDTGNVGEFIGENTTVNEQDVAFTALVLKAHKATSKLVRVPSELITDSAIDVPGVLGSMLGERLGRITNQRYTLGTGTKEPMGIVEAATLGKTAAATGAIIPDELIELVHSVDPAYRPSAVFMLHDNVLLHIRLLKDGNGAYIWQLGNIAQGIPASLLGYRYVVNQDMASSVATTAKTVLFGDFKKYKIRDVNQVTLRLSERYAEYDQEGFVAFLRTDGGLLDAGTNPIKYLVQA